MRTSNDKVINNEEKFETLLPKYKAILSRLVNSFPTKDGSEFEKLVNFQTNLSSPKHGWYDYKQGYSEQLVKHIIELAKPIEEGYVLDPFCGVGTTNLTAQSLGFQSIGTDVNPMAVLATKVKTHFFSQCEIEQIGELIKNFELPIQKDSISVGRAIATSFTDDVLDQLLKIKYFVEHIDEEYIQMFFRLALISIIDKCSLKVKDGNGLKFKKKYIPVPNLVELYLTKASDMLSDIEKANYSSDCQAILGSMISGETYAKLQNYKVNLCVFSPPYANCFDYCEVYKLELWIGGFVKSYKDFEKYRSMALRSHVNSKFDHSLKCYNEDVDNIAEIISTFNIWNKNIPDMLRGYFDDMRELLERIRPMFVPNAKCYIVVANSAYKGILVPTDLLISDIAMKLGYKVNAIYAARRIRSSSQQMQELYSEYDNLMRESIIEIQVL